MESRSIKLCKLFDPLMNDKVKQLSKNYVKRISYSQNSKWHVISMT